HFGWQLFRKVCRRRRPDNIILLKCHYSSPFRDFPQQLRATVRPQGESKEENRSPQNEKGRAVAQPYKPWLKSTR
ncbi:hypothetical protein, partial [Escherichia coli]|uniref:hypothetical protein n=1 Tax=Escherichia coli TaxID=562 RepID=UPI001BC885EF